MGKRIWLALAIVVIPIVYFGSRAVLNVSGMCVAQHKYLANDQLIDAARRATYNSHQGAYRSNEKTGIFGPLTKYNNYDEFVRRNPDCCSISEYGRKGYTLPFSAKIFGMARAIVRVVYQSKEMRGAETPEYEKIYQVISNCGVAWNGV